MVHNPQVGKDLDSSADTIAAIATPAGIGGIGIIRISGPRSTEIARCMTGESVVPRKAMFRKFLDANDRTLDEGILLFFPAPHSYTGEDVCEFQCHGGPVVLHLLLARLMELGARPAEPGEYTKRAFLNEKLDLAQAEAVADLINSSTTAAAHSAMRSLRGDFSQKVHEIVDQVINLRMFIEAAIDFPEEEIDFLENSELVVSVEKIQNLLEDLLQRTSIGCVLREGIAVAIAGLPNAGKSSLLNRLAGRDRVIVTPHAGTTRDTVEVMIDIDGLAVHLTDTAGLRESDDSIEAEGVLRAWNAVQDADIVLYVIDSERGIADDDTHNLNKLENGRVVVVWNKADLTREFESPLPRNDYEQVFVSALAGTGIDDLVQIIQRVAGYDTTEEGIFLARRRHFRSIQRASEYVAQARSALAEDKAGELAAQDLRDAMDELGQITGKLTADELLGEIFSSFCIGK